MNSFVRVGLLAGISYLALCPESHAQKISTLPNSTTPYNGSEQTYLVQGGASKNMTLNQLATWVGPTTPNTTTLRASCTSATSCPSGDPVYASGVLRLTNTVGAQPLLFSPGAGVCATDDGAFCVNSANAAHWAGQFPFGVGNVQQWGAPDDGVTDAGPAINSCLAVMGTCVVPTTASGFFIGTTVIDENARLTGTYISTSDQNSFIYPGSSFLYCASGISPCVQMGVGSGTKGSPALTDLIISRAGGTPASGLIGVLWWDVYGPYVNNVMVRNSGICTRFFGDNSPGFAGSAGQITDLRVNSCSAHYIDNDGWAELMFFGGRIGKNGGGDYPAQDYVYFENSAANVSNVNTISFFGTQFNTGTAADVPQCFFRWGNFASGAAATSEDYKFVGVHAEGGVGGPRTGVICSDSTVNRIGALNISNSEMNTNDGTTPFFALNSNTEIDDWHLNNNTFAGCSGITLAPAPTGSVPGFHAVAITNNFGCNITSYTSPGTHGNILTSTGNTWGGTNIAGTWDGQLVMNEASYGIITDTASGNVYMSEPWQTFTPVLQMNGVSGGWSLSTAVASYQRTTDGGFNVRFNIQVGTTDAGTTGTATLSGLPLTCLTGVNGASVPTVYTLSSVSGTPYAYISATNFLGFVRDNGSGVSTLLTNTNFNSTSDKMDGMVHCTFTK